MASDPQSAHDSAAARPDIMSWLMRGFGFGFGVAIVVGLIALGAAAGKVLILTFVAVLLASALEPMVGGIRNRLPVGRGSTILLVYVGFFVTVLGLAFLVVPAAIGQGQQIVAKMPGLIETTRIWAETLRPAVLSSSVTGLLDSVSTVVAPSGQPDPDTVLEVGTVAAETAVTLATLLTLVFFWLVEHARLQRYLLAFAPLDRRAGMRDAWNEMESRLGLWVRGQLILMGAMGIATGIAYTLLGLPGAILLAFIAALTEAIPIVGPLLGAIPAILVAATVSPELAIVVAGSYVVIQLVEGSVLVPLVMRNTIGFSPLLVLLSLLVGAAVGGLVGAFLAVPIAASLEIVLNRLQARETPVALDPAAIETPDDEARSALERALPDAKGSSAS